MRYAIILSVLAAPAVADCPAGPDFTRQIDEIVQQMQVAPHEGAARGLSAQMWDIWLDAPDEIAQAMLDEGLALLQTGAHASSAAFLQGKYEDALVDLDAAIALQPVHLGALTGKALTLIRMGRDAEAQSVLRAALAINPWLAERALLNEPAGQDI